MTGRGGLVQRSVGFAKMLEDPGLRVRVAGFARRVECLAEVVEGCVEFAGVLVDVAEVVQERCLTVA